MWVRRVKKTDKLCSQPAAVVILTQPEMRIILTIMSITGALLVLIGLFFLIREDSAKTEASFAAAICIAIGIALFKGSSWYRKSRRDRY